MEMKPRKSVRALSELRISYKLTKSEIERLGSMVLIKTLQWAKLTGLFSQRELMIACVKEASCSD